jgi:outer membrane biosynthesis protein TonB
MSVRAERKKQHRRIAFAAAVSLLIHFLILVAALIILSWNSADTKKKPAAPAEPEPIELTIVPPPPPRPTPKKEKDFFDSADGELSEKPPEDAVFESDRDTVASSRLPARSDDPIPTTDGKDEQGLTLVARDLSLGPNKEPAPLSPASPAREPQTPNEKKAKPEPTPPEEEKPSPTPKATPKPTPKPTPRPEDSELAMLDPSRPKPKPPEKKPEKKPEEPSRPSTPQTPGFQPQTRVTRLSGGISSNRRDKDSIASMATPLGRYKKKLSDAIGSRWYYYVNDMLDLVSVGTVQLRFVVRQDGRVEGVQVLQNSANESLASCSVRAIIEAEIPPMSKDVAEVLAGSRLEIDYTFTIVGR